MAEEPVAPGSPFMTTAEAARRLGVRPATLYAYVSRGMIESHRVAGEKESRFARRDVERLAARTRAGGRAAALEVVVDTELTLLDPAGHLYYRGWDAVDACTTASFEQVAEWLWTGAPVSKSASKEWVPRPGALATGERASAVLPESAEPVDRMRAVVAAIATADPLRHDRQPQAVVRCGRQLLATLVASLPDVGSPASGGSLAAKLWPKLTPLAPTKRAIDALNGAMVLLADHELAASTLAARVAASTWADPYLVILTGLGVIGGPLHGAASRQVSDLFADAMSRGSAAEAVGQVLRSGDLVPGFGHRVYTGPDPRAVALGALVRRAWPRSPTVAMADAIAAIVAERGAPHPNVDFGLAMLTDSAGMIPGAGEAIFAVARCAGWLAHAIEEYPHQLRFRPRAAYTGPRPASARN